MQIKIRDLLPQNERQVASLHTEIKPVKHVMKQKKTKENQHKTFAVQNKELYPQIVIVYHFEACIMKSLNE